MRAASTLVLTVLLIAVAAACGGGGGSAAAPGPGPGAATAPGRAAPGAPRPPGLPAGVPTRSDGTPTDAVSRRVIRKWLGALTAGDVPRAARFFAVPSRVQNGSPVLTLGSRTASLAFNLTFPCGARATRLERARGGFTIVDFVLTERRGGDCGGGVGGRARSAIRVADGHIVEWYRLDGAAGAPAPPAPAPGDPSLDPGTQIA